MATTDKNSVRYVFESKPATGKTVRVASGIHWLRLPLPFDLDHINVWLLEDGADWTIVDTGIASDESKAAWRQVFDEVISSIEASPSDCSAACQSLREVGRQHKSRMQELDSGAFQVRSF